ncbi:hypothetical protein BGX34_009413 [Mortierella sp. NVP85]|nr:hypothetical protein BGX34_009413 [Mortierella sp. NVP85]
MRLQSLVFLAAVCTVALALEDPEQSCTGAAFCDTAASAVAPRITATNLPVATSRAPVVLCKQGLPRVISYDQLNPNSINGLTKKLIEEGSHVSPDDFKDGKTIEAILQEGLAVKEKMIGASKPTTAAPPNPVPLTNTTNTNSTMNKMPEKAPENVAKTPATQKSSANKVATCTMGVALVCVASFW